MKFYNKQRRKINRKKSRTTTIILISIILPLIFFVCIKKINTNIKSDEKYIESGIKDEKTETVANVYKNQILLVNKEKGLESEYKPGNLVNVNTKTNQKILMEKEAAEKLQEMFKAAENDGIELIPVSAYRTYEYQKNVFDQSVKSQGIEYTKRYVAVPGYSEHQTGLAIDVGSPEDTTLTDNFENTDAFTWLQKNMHGYGFILRYPKGKENITGYKYEPWHIRYVGKDVAKKIQETGLTLEEFMKK